jgi:hypothetical protein
MKRPFILRLCLYGGILIAFLIYYPFSPGGRQLRNMRLAERSIPKVRALIAQDSRFADVRKLHTVTVKGGSLAIRGEVASESDLADLKRIVCTAFPEVNVAWGVKVRAATPGATEK